MLLPTLARLGRLFDDPNSLEEFRWGTFSQRMRHTNSFLGPQDGDFSVGAKLL